MLIGFIQVESAISRASELSAAVIISVGAPGLILESMPGAVGVIDRKPLFIAAIGRRDIRPRLAAIERSPQIVEKMSARRLR